ncbi:HSP20-like chaperone [Paraphysoderma sedebokerense]|nr:HSP20-like chaperone [Paraphysoderma sedebokerense]
MATDNRGARRDDFGGFNYDVFSDPFFSDPFGTMGLGNRGFGSDFGDFGTRSGNRQLGPSTGTKTPDVDFGTWVPRIPRHLGSRIMDTTEGTLWRPATDVYEEENSIVIHVDLPGVPKEDIQIDTNDQNEITIHGDAKRPGEFVAASSRVRERNIGKFRKIIRLPAGVDFDKVAAKYENGLLEVKVCKIFSWLYK